MAVHAPITSTPVAEPLELLEDVLVWLSQAEAVLALATNEILGRSPEITALGAVEGLLRHSIDQLGVSISSLLKVRHLAA